MKRLNPDKLHVKDLTGTKPDSPLIPRRYTLTHSDITGKLFLTISDDYNQQQISGFFNRLMRDEILAELVQSDKDYEFRVYCHVSGGKVCGTARWRYGIFRREMPLVIQAIRYGDRALFTVNPDFDQTPVIVYYQSHVYQYNHTENRGKIAYYKQ